MRPFVIMQLNHHHHHHRPPHASHTSKSHSTQHQSGRFLAWHRMPGGPVLELLVLQRELLHLGAQAHDLRLQRWRRACRKVAAQPLHDGCHQIFWPLTHGEGDCGAQLPSIPSPMRRPARGAVRPKRVRAAPFCNRRSCTGDSQRPSSNLALAASYLVHTPPICSNCGLESTRREVRGGGVYITV